jgi:hypothetical protein
MSPTAEKRIRKTTIRNAVDTEQHRSHQEFSMLRDVSHHRPVVLVAAFVAAALVVLAAPLPAAARLQPESAPATESQSRHADRSPRRGPGPFMARLVVQKALGRYDAAWKTLHPSHKRVAARTEYVECERLTPFPGLIKSAKVTRVFADPVSIAGMTAPVPSKAVTVRVAVWTAVTSIPVVVTHTFHAVAVNGKWTWILTPERFEAYAADACPTVD